MRSTNYWRTLVCILASSLICQHLVDPYATQEDGWRVIVMFVVRLFVFFVLVDAIGGWIPTEPAKDASAAKADDAAKNNG